MNWSFLNVVLAGVLLCNIPLLGSGDDYSYELENLYNDKKENPRDAFSNNINKCLFSSWTQSSGSDSAVLATDVKCSDSSRYSQLCYGLHPSSKALFAVCYDRKTLIPAFTGHVVKPAKGKGRPAEFRRDLGKFAPDPQAAVADYSATKQQQDFPEFNESENYYCAKGHLTPNSDFGDEDEREETFIITNAAPQWQRFNEGNWLAIEAAVRNYVTTNDTLVYVFTGTGGVARDKSGHPYILNQRVQAPQFYWKAICNPSIKQSIVYVGVNSVGSKSKTKTKGCNGVAQSEDLGVMYCDSLQNIKKKSEYSDFKLPPFYDKNCKTSVRGTFLDPFTHFK